MRSRIALLVALVAMLIAPATATVEIATKYTQVPRDIVEEAYEEFVRGKVWAQNDGLPREKVEYTIKRMVQVGNIKAEEQPRYEDYVAVSLVQEALRGVARVPEYD